MNDTSEGQDPSVDRLLTNGVGRAVLDGMGEGFILLDPAFRIIEINAEGLRIDGRAREEIVGRHLLEVWPEAEHLPTWAAYREASATNAPVTLEYRHSSPTHDVWLEVRAYPTGAGLAVFYRDVTERRTVADAARETETRFRQLATAISKVFYINEVATGRLAYLSPAYEQVWEQPVADTMADPRRYMAPVHPDDRPLVEDAYARQRRGEGTEIQYRLVFGERVKWINDRSFPSNDPDTGERRIVGVAEDVTARRVAEDRLRENEARLRVEAERVQLALAAGAIIGTWNWDLPTDSFTVDEQFARHFGIDPALGREGLSLEQVIATVHPDDVDGLRAAIAEAVARGGAYAHQYRVRNLAGEYHWIEANGRVEHGPDGTPLRFPGVLLDVDARREVEQARDRAEDLLRSFIEAVPGVVYAKDREGRMLVANRGTAELVGKPMDQFIGRTDAEFLDDAAQADAIMANDRRIMDSGVAEQIEEEVSLPDGTRAVWFSTKAPLRNEAGEVVGLIGSSVDITERKRAEAALAESEERFRNLADNAPVMTWVTDASGCCTYLNRQWYEFTGQTRAEAEGFGWLDATHPDDKPMAEEVFLKANAAHEPFRIEYRLRRADGTYRWAIDAASPRFDANGAFLGFVGSVIDIDERREAEEAQRASEARYRELFEAIDAGFSILDIRFDADDRAVDYRHIEINPAFARQTGLADAEGKWVSGIMPNLERFWLDTYGRVAVTGEAMRFENYVADLGRYFDVHAFRTGAPEERRVAVLFNDVTERRRAEDSLRELNATLETRVADAIAEREKVEEALRQSQKMEAVGQLTGGIAHDFNNLLTVVTGNIDMALRNLAASGLEEGRVKRSLDNAMKGAERAAALTQRLLAFSRRQPLAPKPLDVDRLVVDMSDLLNRALGETVKLEVVTSPGLWRVEADPNQLESALLNLAVNARDAMPDGGTLTIETTNARLDEAYAADHAEVAPGQYVVIAVTDTGEGMSKEVVARVFEPFFTTKEVGRGTGLGLSQVYGFTKQSGGHVKVYSEEGRGTTIKIYLPRLISDQGGEDAGGQAQPSRDLARGRETIMVVEDDDDVRAYTVDCLRDLGYQVLEAHDGPAALRLLERQQTPIDLLFTDVVMPGMTGRELADEARKLQPDLKVLYTSGYTRNAIVHGGRLDEGVEMITKPFTYQVLGEKIADMLEVGHTGRLLLVEDDPTVRMFAAEALVGAGYAVDEAATSAEALSRVRAARGRYDAVVLDARLPDRSGDSLAAELRAMHLDMPILLASGEHAAELSQRFAGDRCTGVIAKPYNAASLNKALADLGISCRQS